MNDFLIVTDATCDMPREYLKENGVVCLPMLYSVDGVDYLLMGDGTEMGMQEFYAKMRAGSVTKTAQINTMDAIDRLKPLAEAGKDILYVGFSSALSGTVDAVTKALESLQADFKDSKFLAVDTLCASMGEGLMVHYAVQLKKEGKSITQIHEFLQSNKQNFCHYFTVDDLHFLHRGGRVSKLTAIVGTLLGIKPVLHVSPEGKLINIAKATGRKKALRMLMDKMANKIAISPLKGNDYIKLGDSATDLQKKFNQPIFISHGDCAADAADLAALITETYGTTNIKINYIGPVIGSHSGPNTVAMFFYGTDRKE